jgi:uncharacterized protein YndB with AHSA1/START domain
LHVSSSTDERSITLKVPVERLWRAGLGSTSRASACRPGASLEGKVTNPKYQHLTWRVTIERIEPNRLLSWCWHPAGADPARDYSHEPTTLVEFHLQPVPGGTHLTLVESGFDGVPPGRRLDAFRMNANGWTLQMANIEKHVASG